MASRFPFYSMFRPMSPLLSRHVAAAASNASRRGTSVLPHFMPFDNHRFFSQENNDKKKPLFLINPLDVVKALKEKGLTLELAEIMARVLCDGMEDITKGFVSEQQALTREKTHEVKFSEFKAEIGILRERDLSALEQEFEKQSSAVDKLETKFRCEVDKTIAEIKTHIEVVKYDVLRYCIGTTLAFASFGMAIVCFYYKG